jgi:hypothetical protein
MENRRTEERGKLTGKPQALPPNLNLNQEEAYPLQNL